jgi:hypothetical protein
MPIFIDIGIAKLFTKNILRHENKEQSNQSHPSFSIQITYQCGCHFTLVVKTCHHLILSPWDGNQ